MQMIIHTFENFSLFAILSLFGASFVIMGSFYASCGDPSFFFFCVCEKELGYIYLTCSESLLLWSHPLLISCSASLSTHLDAVVCDVEGERLAWVRGGHASFIPVLVVYGNF